MKASFKIFLVELTQRITFSAQKPPKLFFFSAAFFFFTLMIGRNLLIQSFTFIGKSGRQTKHLRKRGGGGEVAANI
jgi:hypothetical protein